MKRFLVIVLLTLFCAVALLSTDVTGTQSGTWSLANSPYNVIGEVTVPLGSSLSIEPGVTVQAMGNFRINVLGSLSAVGTEADSIRFVSGMTDVNALWTGIRLDNPNSASSLSYCYIEKASYGVNSINTEVVISYCRFSRNEKGMQLYAIGETEPQEMQVTHNIIEYSIHNGILVTQNTNSIISNNEIRYNGTGTQYRGAIQLANQSAGGSCSPEISFNHIHHNLKQGITAWDIMGVNAIEPIIHDNLIENNLTGIYLLNSSGNVYNNTITNNFIAGDMNSGAGVMVSGATSQPYFEDNIITGNYTGFYITGNAVPVLGNMAINHAWAQGGNTISDNIDANGDLHSVYCYQYSAAGNVIYAENNFWGADDAAGIAAGIYDHNDSAALPTVDFDPWQTGVIPSLVNGSYSYDGSYTITDTRLQLVSVETGEVVFEAPVQSQNFAYSVNLTGQFYAVMLATATGSGRTLYGIAGGMTTPDVFSPGDLIEVWVGNIEIVDAEPFSYQRIAAPVIEEGHTVYPVYGGFFVYSWGRINWLYRDGDYLKMMKYTIRLDSGSQTWVIPTELRTWDKIDNIVDGDSWTKVSVVDQTGTIVTSQVTAESIADSGNYPVGWLLRESLNSQTVGERIVRNNEFLICVYAGYWLSGLWERFNYLVEPDGTQFPLAEGNTWIYLPQELSDNPTRLFYNPMTIATNQVQVNLYWQPPRQSVPWQTYRIYRNGVLHAEQPVSVLSDFYWSEEFSATGLTYTYHLTAFDGSTESQPTNSIIIQTTGVDEEVPAPRVLTVYPNPFRVSEGSLRIELSNAKESDAEVEIYNLRGQRLVSEKLDAAQNLQYAWDGRDMSGKACGAGIYFIRVRQADAPVLQRKVVLIR